MLSKLIDDFYSKLALSFYRNAANYQCKDDIQSLSSTELSTLEIVYLLNRPTIKELTEFMKISTPNAAYRINKLVEKGYLTREQDQADRRKYTLDVTDKFMRYYCVNDEFMETVAQRARERFSPAEMGQLESMLKIMTEELME